MNQLPRHASLVVWLPILGCCAWLVACEAGDDASLEDQELGSLSEGIGIQPVDVTHMPSPVVPLWAPPSAAESEAERVRLQANAQKQEANARSWGESKVKWLFDVECGLAGVWPGRHNECCYKYPEGWGVGGPGQTKCSDFCNRMFIPKNEIQACNDGCMTEFTRVCQSKNGG